MTPIIPVPVRAVLPVHFEVPVYRAHRSLYYWRDHLLGQYDAPVPAPALYVYRHRSAVILVINQT